jgi:Ca2+-binding RTX toxin-like protein
LVRLVRAFTPAPHRPQVVVTNAVAPVALSEANIIDTGRDLANSHGILRKGLAMIYSTGANSDFFVFDLVFQGYDTWSDSGGQDVLILSEFLPNPMRSMVNTGTAITVQMFGGELTIPHDPFNMPSVEYLEWRQQPFGPGQPPTIKAVLKIVTDLSAISGVDIAVIGTNAGETILAPEAGMLQDGFSEIYGAGGRDHITLSSTMSFRAFGGDGRDVIRAKGAVDNFISGDNGADRLVGAGGDDIIYGGRGTDTILGRGGDDRLFGDLLPYPRQGSGDDRIKGGKGDDFISGGAGNDVLTGGAGRDQFDFGFFDTGIDRITDFDALRDRISFDKDTRPGRYTVTIQDGDTHLAYGGLTFVVLENVELTRSEITIDFL